MNLKISAISPFFGFGAFAVAALSLSAMSSEPFETPENSRFSISLRRQTLTNLSILYYLRPYWKALDGMWKISLPLLTKLGITSSEIEHHYTTLKEASQMPEAGEIDNNALEDFVTACWALNLQSVVVTLRDLWPSPYLRFLAPSPSPGLLSRASDSLWREGQSDQPLREQVFDSLDDTG
ncbi:hypothetical protein FE257_004414 [Aspergillus nanangensis]|uniref:Uncharacterized protein n=1 Tax=Aspergillus nanangensis TaxID=2582783 RepID=A0AAD4H0K1_ASPNN|nr:hypothetical protein FE257_004414 [Aspergillus nanangensis]